MQPESRRMLRKAWPHLLAALLVLIFFAELAADVHRQSLSWDEGDHIFAGYQSWKTHDFGINPEHPPFVKALATVPLLFMHLETPPSKHLPFFKDEAYFDGYDLIFHQRGGLAEAKQIIFRARMFAATLSVGMAVLVYLAGLEMFGAPAALLALALVVFEPNLIAHGAYVTTDMGVTCFLFAVFFALYRFRRRPGWGRLLVLGIAVGLALASKHSAVLMLPMALVLTGCDLLLAKAPERRTAIARQYAVAYGGGLVVGVLLLWTAYGFRYSVHPNGTHMSPSLVEYMQPLHGVEPKVYGFLGAHHLLPESYLYGLVDIRRQSLPGTSFPTYIFGQVHAHGVWYYFPAAFLIKSTIPFMLLLLLAVFAIAAGRLRGRQRLLFLIIPPAVYLSVAMATGLDIGVRHILPTYPFFAVLAGGAAVCLARMHRAWAVAISLLVCWHVVTTVRSFPNPIAYSNEFWGGPSQTWRYLTDSNVDWGQQLQSVKAYLDRNDIHDCWFGYFVYPEIDYRTYGIPCRPLPTQDAIWAHRQVDAPATITGTVLVSAGTLSGYEFGSDRLSPYQVFQRAKPVAQIDDGVFVYRGSFNTSFAAALGHATRADALLAKQDSAAALAEAQQAVAVNPQVLQAQMALGDSFAALHHTPEAAAAYARALAITQSMEPDARGDWTVIIRDKTQALKPSQPAP